MEAKLARAAAAERATAAQEAARDEAERARVRNSREADEAQAELRHAQGLLDACVWRSGSDQRVAAVRSNATPTACSDSWQHRAAGQPYPLHR